MNHPAIKGCSKGRVIPVTILHDCGVILQPVSEAVPCEFEITNNTNFDWNLKQIVNMCSCTVTDMSTTRIKVGATEKVLVAYKPGGEGSFDDHRRSLVVFEEKDAPVFTLVVTSRVREPMTVKPGTLAWTRVGENQVRKDCFEVQNYSSENWESLNVISYPGWLAYEIQSVDPPESDSSLRQLYLVSLNVDAKDLSPREYRDSIELEARCGERILTKSVPAVLQITSTVSAIPGQFFFGDVTVGEPVTKSIRLVFAPDAVPSDVSRVSWEHNLGDALNLWWIQTAGETWELQATLTLNSTELPEDPHVAIRFADERLSSLNLPVYIMTRTGGEP